MLLIFEVNAFDIVQSYNMICHQLNSVVDAGLDSTSTILPQDVICIFFSEIIFVAYNSKFFLPEMF